jgi:hypothetical protein
MFPLLLLQERVSADPADPEILALQQQLEELGPGPRRPPLTLTEEQAMRTRAQQQLDAGEVGGVNDTLSIVCMGRVHCMDAA